MIIVNNTAFNYACGKTTRRLLLLCLFCLIFSGVWGQAPNISYPTPQVYTVNTPIATLSPTNTGGAVPSYAYGSVGVLAGNGTAGSTDATGTAASFNAPQSIAIDAAGNFYVPEYNNKVIRKITPAGVVTTYAGILNTVGRTDGPALSATFNGPTSVAFDSGGNMFIADYQGETIRKITPAGIVSTFAGSGILGYTDGVGTAAVFNQPYGIAIDKNDNIYVAEVGNHTIRKITPAGVVTTLAGNGFSGQSDGTGSSAQFSGPQYLTTDASGNVYVSDSGNNAIRKVTPAGVVTTIAGVLPGVPPALSNIGIPGGIRITPAGNIYFASLNKNQIYEITSAGSLVLIAGSGAVGSANGSGASATFKRPQDIEFDATGNLYVADQDNYLIRTVNTTGYTINKLPPAGINFDARTGTFFGTPTVTSLPTDYTVTAYNLGGVSTTVLNIAVNATAVVIPPTVAPNITYPTPPTYTTNSTAITPLSPTNRGGISTSYAIDKPLPAGLSFDLTTGTISGTPTATSTATSYTITASNLGGNSIKTINIEVKDPSTLISSAIIFPTPVAGVSQVGADGVLITGITSNNTESPIIYTISDPSTAYIGGDGLIHVVGGGSGTINITASQNASTHYTAAAPITQSFVIMQVQNITFSNINTKVICQPDFPAAATSSNPNIPITYTSSNTLVATVSASGMIHIVGPGGVRITASQAGDALHNAAISQSQSFTVTAPLKPLVNVITNNYSYCPGTPQPLTALISNLNLLGATVDYQWQLNGVNVGTNSDRYAPVISITDVVKCIVTAHHLCGDVIGVDSTYNIQPLPTAKITVNVTASKTGPICRGTFLTFTAKPNDAGTNPSYQWKVNGINAGNNFATFGTNSLVNGDVVTCFFTHSSIACLPNPTATSNAVTVNIVTPANPAPSVSISPSVNHVYVGTPITFTASVLNATATTSYQWQVNGVNAGTNSATFTSSDFANKDTVTCTIISGTCDAPAVSPAVALIILPPFVIKPPNTFTPNGDGINDLWDIIGLSDFPNCLVAVYNRYGTEVFKSRGYSKSWNGLYKANVLPVGTYYYVIDLDGKKPKVSGYVTIIR
jgi:gliding motility-associated-like protein